MKILALLVIAFSLILGVVGAVTAYLPRIDNDAGAQKAQGLHLNAPSGARTAAEGEDPAPIAEPGQTLTPELIAELRQGGVERVKTKEFAFGRWTGWWLFALGCAGLLGAGLYLRRDAARALSAADATATASGPADPATTLAAIRAEVDHLLAALRRGEEPAGTTAFSGPATAARPSIGAAEAMTPGTSAPAGSPAWAGPPGPVAAVPVDRGDSANDLIVERIGALQKTHLPAFLDARPRIVATGGMAGYARLMDAYAAAERQLNRAWSAAADGDESEAVAALHRVLPLLDESAQRLPRG